MSEVAEMIRSDFKVEHYPKFLKFRSTPDEKLYGGSKVDTIYAKDNIEKYEWVSSYPQGFNPENEIRQPI